VLSLCVLSGNGSVDKKLKNVDCIGLWLSMGRSYSPLLNIIQSRDTSRNAIMIASNGHRLHNVINGNHKL